MLARNTFLKDLEKLISIETLTTNLEQNKILLDFVESTIKGGAVIQRIKNNNSEILVASNQNTTRPDVAYLVHSDVVAANPEQFRMIVKGNRVYGRGTSDMKFSIPVGYSLLNELIGRKSNLSFALIVTTDEEVGGFDGTEFLVKRLRYRPKLVIVPDGGDNFEFIEKMKGICTLHIDAKGKSAHASYPWLGKNANELLVKLSNELLSRYGKNSKKPNWNTTVNIGVIHGGLVANQVCASAHMKVDIRFPEIRTMNEIKKEVTQLAKKIDPGIKIISHAAGAASYVSLNDPHIRSFISSIEKTIGRKMKIGAAYGASDSRHFSAYGIPIIMTKPRGANIHSDNEWVDIKQCLLFYKALGRYLEELEYRTSNK